ncbi:MAG: DUF87 domain-containing protein [Candidatus Thiodiazotropha sp. (ex Ctena orbiculata)]|nr:DUF87 domain-containing protein [Candidatus Thiodiazotropha taylori]
MSSTSDLLQKIFQVTRGDLDNARLPFPDPIEIVESMQLHRLRKIERFWKDSGQHSWPVLGKCIEELVIGWHGQGEPLFLALLGNVKEVQCWYGVPRKLRHNPSQAKLLRSILPGAIVESNGTIDIEAIERFSSAVIVTGIPDKAGRNLEHGNTSGIERIIRGLNGSNWMYGVYAEPVPAVEALRLLTETTEEIREVYSTYLLKGSPTDENNRTAKRYVDLLEANQRRLEYGRSSGMWAVHTMLLTEGEGSLSSAQGLLHSTFSGENSQPEPLRVLRCSKTHAKMPVFGPLTSKELAVLSMPPSEEYPGYQVADHVRFSVDVPTIAGNKDERLSIGNIKDRSEDTSNSFDINRGDLAKHILVAGVTGSGKTNTCFLLLERLWAQGRGVPFLVIEPAKSEYRWLLSSPKFPNLRVFTVGDERLSPLRLNPLAVPEGILVQTHIDLIKALFSAAFVLYPPMPYVLEQSLQEVYEDKGWDIAQNVNYRGTGSLASTPTLGDLASKVRQVVDRMGYDERITMDIKAGLVARINQLCRGGGKGIMLNTRSSIDFRSLLSTPCVFELKQVASDDEKAFLIGLLLILIYEYNEITAASSSQALRHITLIEEAHRLLRNSTVEKGNEVHANPRGQAIEVFSNILSEIRAYGEGFIVAEQIPTKLATDVIKNTNLKVIHRLVSQEDRQTVGSAMNMEDNQVKALATLRTGEAVAFCENVDRPVLIGVSLSELKKQSKMLSDNDVRALMEGFWKGKETLLWPYSACQRCTGETRSKRFCDRTEYTKIDGITRSAFVKLFNALRLNKALVWSAYEEYFAACRSQLPSQEEHSYCTFVSLSSEHIERRGDFYGWRHEDVEEVTKDIWSAMYKLTSKTEKLSRKNILTSATKEFLSFSNRMETLHKVDSKPYAGCRYCEKPCLYRFDMRMSELGQFESEFRDRFMDENSPLIDVAKVCWSASNQIFLSTDIRSRRAASLCWSIQQLAGLGLSIKNQSEMAAEFSRSISELGTEQRIGAA